MSGLTNSIGLVINSTNPLTTLNGGIGRSVTPTSGSVLFYDATGVQQNNSSFFWNNSNLQLGIGTNSFDFTGVNFQMTSNSVSGVSAVIRSSLTGSANQAALYVCRGDQTNGNALVRFVTGVAGSTTPDWDIGTLNSGLSTPTNFVFSNTGGNRLLLSSAGILNLPSLTASQAVVTDSSKNLSSLAYTNANTASTLVQRDASGNFSAGTITASGINLSALTQGSVLFSGASGAISQDNSNYFYDSTNHQLYVGANSSAQTFQTPGVLNLYGTNGTTNNSLKFYTTADGYSGLNLFDDAHGNQAINFDCFWNGSTNISSYSGGNFQINHSTGNLTIAYATGISQGSSVPLVNGLGLSAANGNVTCYTGNLVFNTAGKTLQLTTGTNACRGTATMATGSASVSTTAAGTGNMVIVTGPGANSYGYTITNGVGFSITSSNILDATTVNWAIIK